MTIIKMLSVSALDISYIPHARFPLPGVVHVCARDQGYSVWLQAPHPGGCCPALL